LLACISCCFNCPFKCMSPAVYLLNFILGEKHQTLYCPLAIICSHWNTSTLALVCGLSVSCCHTECWVDLYKLFLLSFPRSLQPLCLLLWHPRILILICTQLMTQFHLVWALLWIYWY
jgi:hypothetical protein